MIAIDKNDSIQQIGRGVIRALDGTDTNLPVAGPIASAIGAVWDSFSQYAAFYPRLQYYYTLRMVADNILMGVWPLTDYSQGGVDDKLSQKFGQLHTLRSDADKEINSLLMQARASQVSTSGVMGQGQLGSVNAPDNPLACTSPLGYPLGDFGSISGGPNGPFGRGW